MNRIDWLSKLQNNNIPPKYPELDAKICQHIKEKGSIVSVEGAFGDTFRNLGFVEEYIKTDKGIQTKFYGCSILFKGDLRREVIDGVATVKRVMMASAELALKYKFSLIRFLFSYKKALRNFVDWFIQIYEADLGQKSYKNLNDFAPVPRELIRAGLKLAEEIPLGKYPLSRWGPREYRIDVKRLFWCVGTIIQSDFAYYWRVQDPLSNFQKTNDIRKEIGRLFNLAIERENQIKEKFIILKRAAMIILLFPPIKRLAIKYFNELNIDKIQPDEEDVYWSGRRAGYNFGGISYEEKIKEIERIDKEKGNVIIL